MDKGLHNVSYGDTLPFTTCEAELERAQVKRGGGALVERVCAHCGATFLLLARRAKRPGRGRYCSRSCQGAAIVLRRNAVRPPVGSANGNWKGGVSQHPVRYTRRFRAKFPEKYRAQQAVHEAVASGRLIRPDACSACSAACKPHGHHDDYSQPLSVRWLCGACHRAHHNSLRRTA